MKPILALALLLTALAPGAGAGQLYKSVGPNGEVVYGDRPPGEGRVEKTMTFKDLPASSLPASAQTYVEQLRRFRASVQSSAAASASPTGAAAGGVVLFSAAWCGYCKKAKAHLAARGVAYQEVDVGTKTGIAAFAEAGGGKGVPLLVKGGQRVQGFSAEAYDVVLAGTR